MLGIFIISTELGTFINIYFFRVLYFEKSTILRKSLRVDI